MQPTIQTVAGRYFNFERPELSVFSIYEIAHALSNICRFTGHTLQHYSVAQHSVLVSQQVPHEHAMAGLLHDAAEAFIGDVSAPLKALLPDYKVIERRVEAAIFPRFGLPAKLPLEVKAADLVLLNTERRDLMTPTGDAWQSLEGVGTLRQTIAPLKAHDARQLFLDRFFALGGIA